MEYEIVLFVSKYSPNSRECVRGIQQINIPMKVCFLDKPELRKRATSGSFQITSVPTLALKSVEGDVKLFLGTEKIIGIVQRIANEHFSQSSSTHSTPINSVEPKPKPYLQDFKSEMISKEYAPEKKKKKKKSSKKKSKKVVFNEDVAVKTIENVPLTSNDNQDDNMDVLEPLDGSISNMEDGGAEIEFLDGPPPSISQSHSTYSTPMNKPSRNPLTQTSSKNDVRKKKSQQLKASVEKMMRDREATMGHDPTQQNW